MEPDLCIVLDESTPDVMGGVGRGGGADEDMTPTDEPINGVLYVDDCDGTEDEPIDGLPKAPKSEKAAKVGGTANTFRDCGKVCGISMPFNLSEMRCKAMENSFISIRPSESTSAKDQIWAKTLGGSPEDNINVFACSPLMKSEREEQIRTNCDSYLAFWSGVITNTSD
jgi:hypothetical protein